MKEAIETLDPEFKTDVIEYFVAQASQAHSSLEKLMVENATTMTGKQYRFCWRLVDFLREFSRLTGKYDNYLWEQLHPRFESEWLPAFQYFEPKPHWNKWIRRYFQWDFKK